MKTLAIRFVLYAATAVRPAAQATDCKDPHASPEANASFAAAMGPGRSPVHADATELARTSDESGFQAQRIRRSEKSAFLRDRRARHGSRLTEGFSKFGFCRRLRLLLVWR